MATPLKKISIKEGKPYQRRLEIEQLIDELEDLPETKLTQRCRDNDSPVPLEVLLYFLRKKIGSLSRYHFEVVFTVFFSRLEASLKRKIPDWMYDSSEGIRQEILGSFAEMIAKDRNGEEGRLDFYEVNFNSCFANLRTDVLRRIGPAKKTDPLENASPLTGMDDDIVEILPDVEKRIIEDFELGLSKLDDLSFRFKLHAAINDLPDDEREAIGLLLLGMPIEAKDPSVCTISRTLQCAVKTVNNRLNRAYRKLQAILAAEE